MHIQNNLNIQREKLKDPFGESGPTRMQQNNVVAQAIPPYVFAQTSGLLLVGELALVIVVVSPQLEGYICLPQVLPHPISAGQLCSVHQGS